MVKRIKERKKALFVCEECKFMYENRATADECEKWCSRNKSCNIKITKNAIGSYNG